jgi:Mor family transcriptional regulator
MFPINQGGALRDSAREASQPIGDPCDDIVAHILQLAQLPVEQAERIEREIRAYWGGERPYIAKLGELGKRLMSARYESIRTESRRGESDQFLARRWGLTPRHIRRIVSAK